MGIPISRFWFINAIVSIVFLTVSYQLLQLGFLRKDSLIELAHRQHYLNVEVPSLRGGILDRSGKEIATSLKVPSVFAVPRIIEGRERKHLAGQLSKILDLPPAFLMERLDRNKAFIWLKRRVTEQEAKDVAALKHPALGTFYEFKRFYPQGSQLANVLGFTDTDNQGLEGIELALNRELQGRAGGRLTKRDARGREIKSLEVNATPAINGHQVTLTIDSHLQYLTERALERAFTKWNAKGASAVVMDPMTGEILAIASRPSYDPNEYFRSSPDMRRLRPITDMYEPGSIFKIVTASAVLNENKATVATVFECENGHYRYYGSRVLHDVHGYGKLSMPEVIIKSSNIGTVKMASLLDHQVLQKYIELFGFGKPTGADLPGEATGYTRPPSEWSATSPFNIPIGQEILVTPVQMATAMAVIANGGNLVRPFITKHIDDEFGVRLHETKPFIRRRVIRSEVADTMRQILVRAVEEGTGKSAFMKGIPAGGKTGTAQKILPNGRGYSHNSFMASFIGFAPADHPRYVMVIVLDDPKPKYYGGTVAAPVFKEVMESALLAAGYVPEDVGQQPVASQRQIQNPPANLPKILPVGAAGKGL